MSKAEELTRELEALKNNGLIKSYAVLPLGDDEFAVRVVIHESRAEAPANG